jgi:hypothetical protein
MEVERLGTVMKGTATWVHHRRCHDYCLDNCFSLHPLDFIGTGSGCFLITGTGIGPPFVWTNWARWTRLLAQAWDGLTLHWYKFSLFWRFAACLGPHSGSLWHRLWAVPGLMLFTWFLAFYRHLSAPLAETGFTTNFFPLPMAGVLCCTDSNTGSAPGSWKNHPALQRQFGSGGLEPIPRKFSPHKTNWVSAADRLDCSLWLAIIPAHPATERTSWHLLLLLRLCSVGWDGFTKFFGGGFRKVLESIFSTSCHL